MPFLRQVVKAALPNKQKQTQGGCQFEESKKYGPNERIDKTPEKELNETEITNLSDAELKTLMTRMLRDLTEYGNNTREEMKVTLSDIKRNLQGTNSGEVEAENQVNKLEHKEGKNIQSE